MSDTWDTLENVAGTMTTPTTEIRLWTGDNEWHTEHWPICPIAGDRVLIDGLDYYIVVRREFACNEGKLIVHLIMEKLA